MSREGQAQLCQRHGLQPTNWTTTAPELPAGPCPRPLREGGGSGSQDNSRGGREAPPCLQGGLDQLCGHPPNRGENQDQGPEPPGIGSLLGAARPLGPPGRGPRGPLRSLGAGGPGVRGTYLFQQVLVRSDEQLLLFDPFGILGKAPIMFTRVEANRQLRNKKCQGERSLPPLE